MINFWAVLMAAVAAIIIGSVWYSKIMFGAYWLRILNKRPEETNGAGRAMSIMTIAAFITAYVMAHFANYANATTVIDGLALGFWVWLGFVVTTNITTSNFEGRPWSLFYIYAGNELVTFLVMGVILSLWR